MKSKKLILKVKADAQAIKEKAEQVKANVERIASIENSDFAKSDVSKLYRAHVQHLIKKVEAGEMPKSFYYVNRKGELTTKADLTKIDIAATTNLLLSHYTADDAYNAIMLHSNTIRAEYDPQQKKGAAKVQDGATYVINRALSSMSTIHAHTLNAIVLQWKRALALNHRLQEK